MADLRSQFGDIDIHLFDQLLRGRLSPRMHVLDAGCGTGRNLICMMNAGYEVHGADADASAVETVRRLASELAPRAWIDDLHDGLLRDLDTTLGSTSA